MPGIKKTYQAYNNNKTFKFWSYPGKYNSYFLLNQNNDNDNDNSSKLCYEYEDDNYIERDNGITGYDNYDDYNNSEDSHKMFKPPTIPRKEIDSMKPSLSLEKNGKGFSINLKCICDASLRKIKKLNKEQIFCDKCGIVIINKWYWGCDTDDVHRFVKYHGWYWHKTINKWIRLSSGYALCYKCIIKFYPNHYRYLGKVYSEKKIINALLSLK